jgi:hypothetical protein
VLYEFVWRWDFHVPDFQAKTGLLGCCRPVTRAGSPETSTNKMFPAMPQRILLLETYRADGEGLGRRFAGGRIYHNKLERELPARLPCQLGVAYLLSR